MQTFLYTIILAIFTMLPSKTTANEHTYLKINLHQKTISYPPGTPFVAKDAKGVVVLSMYDLKIAKKYEITEPITLVVYVSWSDSPDVYTLKNGTLSLEHAKQHRKKEVSKEKTPPKAYFQQDSERDASTHTSEKTYDNVYLIKKQYFSYDEDTGYDVSLKFSNGIQFLYKDGKANAWKDGKELNIKHKYIIQTDEGALKLSYNPQTQKIWWIFDKN